MARILLIAILVLGIAVDVFFAAVNFYPMAPPRRPGPRREIIAEMDSGHARWFQNNVLDEFNREHNSSLVLRLVPGDQLLANLRTAREHDVLLAVLPGAVTRRAVQDHLVRPFEGLPAASALAADFSSLRTEVLAAGRFEGRQYFLPRMTVLDLGLYRPSKVRDAVLHWLQVRPFIEAALRSVNGFGLPEGYELERSPAEWDAYDQFVIAYYWAHRSYGGQPARPRLAHRSDPGTPGETYLLSTLYRAGATDATIRHTDNPAAVDHMAWERLYRNEGLYVDAMFAPGGMNPEGIIDGFMRGRIFLAPVDEIEAFRIHGGARRDAEAQVDAPEDLGFFAMPRGASLALGADHRPERVENGFSFREDSMWALPVNGPDSALAYEFVKFAWSRDPHIRECEAIGILPLRSDVVLERASIFRLDWEQDIFEGALSQWQRAEPVPPGLLEDGIGATYAQHWQNLVVHSSGPMDLAGVAAVLRMPPAAAPARPQAPPAAPATDERDDGEPWRSQVLLQLPDSGTPADAANGRPAR